MRVHFYSAISDKAIPSGLDLSAHNIINQKGDIQDALNAILENQSEILFLEGFPPTDELLDTLSKLSAALPNLEIVMSLHDRRRKWNSPNPDFLIRAMRSGVREMIPHFTKETVDEFLKRAFLRYENKSNGKELKNKIIAFIGAKGGDGATSILANIAGALSNDSSKKVLMIDLSLPFGDLEVCFSNINKRFDLSNFSEEVERLDLPLVEAMVEHIAPNLDLISTPENVERIVLIKPDCIGRIIDLGTQKYDYVLIDIGVGIDPISIHALGKVDELYIVSTLSIPSIRKTSKFIKFWEDLNYDLEKLHFIINKFDKDAGISIHDYEKIIGTHVDKVFSKDENSLRNAQLKGKLLVSLAANAKFSQEITEWANEWLGKKKDKSLWHRLGIK